MNDVLDPHPLSPLAANAAGPDHPRDSSSLAAAVVLTAAFIVVLVRTAWVSDDAFITLRVLDNWVHGFGLRWNTAERVWGYTNPLWLLAFTPVYYLTREAFFSVTFFSIAVSALAFWLAVRRGAGGRGLLVGLLLIGSKAFVDYSTSGLENPLAHLLLVVFFLLLLGQEEDRRRPALMALIAGGAVLCRFDAVLIYLPALAWVLARTPRLKALRAVLIGFAPLIAWEVFAVIYYGFPLPNTAYAKLGGQIGQGVRLEQGMYYFLNSVDWDPLTLLTIGAGVGLAFCSRRAPLVLIGLGCVLHLCYVLWIGGDFMSGRFFSSPLLAAALIVGRWPARLAPAHEALLCALPLAFALVAPRSPLRAAGTDAADPAPSIDARGIADERKYYYGNSGLLQAVQQQNLPRSQFAEDGRTLRKMSGPDRKVVYQKGIAIGALGYFAGPYVHIIDRFALTDAYLVRLPQVRASRFRPGHVMHQVPPEYAACLYSGMNTIQLPAAARLYDAVARVTRDPLLSGPRLREVVRLNTGYYGPAQRAIAARLGNGVNAFPYAEVAAPVKEGTPWNDARAFIMDGRGITVRLDGVQNCARLEATLLNGRAFRLEFARAGRAVGAIQTRVPVLEGSLLKLITLDLPAPLRAAGFDTIAVRPVAAAGRASLGHLRLLGGAEAPGEVLKEKNNTKEYKERG